jgi:hypothetical protein
MPAAKTTQAAPTPITVVLNFRVIVLFVDVRHDWGERRTNRQGDSLFGGGRIKAGVLGCVVLIGGPFQTKILIDLATQLPNVIDDSFRHESKIAGIERQYVMPKRSQRQFQFV